MDEYKEYPGSGDGGRTAKIVVIVILVAILTVLSVLYFQKCEELEDKEWELSVKSQKLGETEDNLDFLKSILRKNIPIIITDIEIANTYEGGKIETEYGGWIRSENSMYLTPCITYYCVTTDNITLKVKLRDQYDNISQGNTSPHDCTYTYEIKVREYEGIGLMNKKIWPDGPNRETINGWGNSTKGHWARGNYVLEIWYNDVCLKSKTFTIH